jgi:hypothetical protein
LMNFVEYLLLDYSNAISFCSLLGVHRMNGYVYTILR